MYKIKLLEDEQTAKRIGEFMTSKFAFDQTWAPKEKASVMHAPIDSLSHPNHQYWYVEEDGEIIGAIGVNVNKYGSNGFEMDSDYLAVHTKHRRKGLASKLLSKMEAFVQGKAGRYIHILACDIDSYKPAHEFYKRHGYKKVADIPNYYVKNEGRIDFLKEF